MITRAVLDESDECLKYDACQDRFLVTMLANVSECRTCIVIVSFNPDNVTVIYGQESREV